MKSECQDCDAYVETKTLTLTIGSIICGRMNLCATCVRRRYKSQGREAPNEKRVVDAGGDLTN